jgi:DNA-binding XRE family transcriptional regulator
MSEDKATKRAKKALDTIIRDDQAWGAMLSLTYSRGLRDDIVMRRLQLGMTQTELAQRMGVTQATVAEFETCDYPDPHLSTLRRYYLSLGLSMTYGVTESLKGMRERLGDERSED